MNTVILGGSGFMGSSLAKRFSQQGEQVITVSRSPMQSFSASHRHYDITLDDRRALASLVSDADFVFHLASDTTPGSSRLQPGLEVSNNLLPMAGLLECLQENPGATLVYVSSGGAIYDTTPAIASTATTLGESSPTAPPSYYGAGKLAAEALIHAYHQQTRQTVVILRPSNVYGPGQRAKTQFGIIPTLCQCLQERKPFTIWGDGSAVRDYVYVDDFLALCEAVTQHAWANTDFQTLNAGTGTGCSIVQLCELLEDIANVPLERDFQAPRGVDTGQVILDSLRAQELLGWRAGTPLKEGLKQTWQWYQRQA
ncbi:MAG: NAD-dependent epimerase/dehydratase family protein [Pseudomonadota bacterium]